MQKLEILFDNDWTPPTPKETEIKNYKTAFKEIFRIAELIQRNLPLICWNQHYIEEIKSIINGQLDENIHPDDSIDSLTYAIKNRKGKIKMQNIKITTPNKPTHVTVSTPDKATHVTVETSIHPNEKCPSCDCGMCATFPAPYEVQCGGEETKNCIWLLEDFELFKYDDRDKMRVSIELEKDKKNANR